MSAEAKFKGIFMYYARKGKKEAVEGIGMAKVGLLIGALISNIRDPSICALQMSYQTTKQRNHIEIPSPNMKELWENFQCRVGLEKNAIVW
ncbi:hypothetical protein KY285_022581 [Solanum tuberosum]|nr:hypothetical protein KY285_022581 [Solanum tuberosum]